MTAGLTCPSCGGACPVDARFCQHCGTALAAPAHHAVERKVVTTLFCDLVDYTAFCEEVDPEEADKVLREFYALARRAIETYGGVVEKFIGDAVLGVFGVPISHEDDAERAVVTAMRLLDRVPTLPRPASRELRVRIGVNTGTAVVRLDVMPGSGEGFLVGDAVNTAARLQKLAPPMGVVVGEKTHALTARSIAYEALAPAAVKGKHSAVKCWLAKAPVSRMGVDLRRQFPAPLVDREVELGILRGLFEKVRASSQPQFALVVGEAGIGKSRLVFELLRHVDSRPFIVRWRQGRCPAYGDGLTFWALGEIVREQLGVVERDEVATIEAKLADALAGVDDQEWLAARLRPLLGLESPAASREENFAAWRRFIEMVAGDSPAVIVVEDLHWASEATLAFLGDLVEHIADVPLLAICTTRPELLRARPDVAAHLGGVAPVQRGVRIDLQPLSEPETQELVARVGPGLGDFVETQQTLARRAAGNPLYAEQLVRLVQGEPTIGGPTTDVALKERVAEALPESLQSLIAARLDDLPPERKTLLGDAAVVGEVFWAGAVAALDHGDRSAAEAGLDDLARRDLVRHERDSSVAGESEFAFRHGLIRDVAYSQLTRADRALKHAAVARWVEAVAGERVEEVAEILAHHYAVALELARTVGNEELRQELVEPTVRALRLAGDGALALDVGAAGRHYERALDILTLDAPARFPLLAAWGNALAMGGRLRDAVPALEEAIDGLREAGDVRAAAVAMTWLSEAFTELADKRAPLVARAALALLEGDEPSPEQVLVLQRWASTCLTTSDARAALESAERAMAVAERLGLPVTSKTLEIKAAACCALGNVAEGLNDARSAIDISRLGSPSPVGSATVHVATGELVATFETTAGGLAIHRAGLRVADARHDEMGGASLRLGVFEGLVFLGRWDEAAADGDALEDLLETGGHLFALADVRSLKALLHVLRGEAAAARPLIAWTESEAGELFGSPVLNLLASAATRDALGDGAGASAWLRDLAKWDEGFVAMPRMTLWWPTAVRLAVRLAERDLSARLSGRLLESLAAPRHARLTVEALEASASGRPDDAAAAFAAAADAWRRGEVPHEQAQALLWRGRCLLELGRVAEATSALKAARRLFVTLKARPALAETDLLLREAGLGPPRRRERKSQESPDSGSAGHR